MKKTNKHYQKKSAYEIKQNTSYFVKNRLPAFVLAGFMIFWTIASIFGIIAYCKQDKKESTLNIVGANADTVNNYGYKDNWEIPLNAFVGMQLLDFTVGDCPYLIFGQDVVDGSYIYLATKHEYEDYILNGEKDGLVSLKPPAGSSSTDGDFSLTGFTVDGITTLDCYYWASGVFDIDTVSRNAYYYYPYSVEYDYEYYDVESCIVKINLVLAYGGYNPIQYQSFYFEIEFESVFSGSSNGGYCPYFNEIMYTYTTADLGVDQFNNTVYKDMAVNYYWSEVDRLDLANLREQYESLENRYNELVANSGRETELLNSKVQELTAEVERLRGLINIRDKTISDLVGDITENKNEYESLVSQLRTTISELERTIAQKDVQINSNYEEGKKVGYNNGYNKGFNDGVANANNYSFEGLLSAVFDVPIRTFTSLFDFDLLGVNLASFFFSLLTACVIIAVIRWIL